MNYCEIEFFFFLIKIPGTTTFVVSDRNERREIKERMANLSREIKALQAAKKEKLNQVSDASKLVKALKERENTVKDASGGYYKDIIGKVEEIFQKYHITKPYYHGGKYNGKGMCTFMTASSKIMEDIKNMIISLPQEDRCNDDKVLQYTQRFHNCLQVFDFVFSKARQPSGSIDAGDIENLQPFITTALKLYRELGLKIPPKAHAIEDHLCEQLLRLKGTGDLGEDFVEQSHQDGIRKEARSRNARSREETAIMHCKWEHKQQLPEVLDKAKIAARKSVRTKRIADQNGTLEAVPITNKGDKKRRVAENKLTTRTLALQNTTEVDGVYLKSGRQINIDDTRRKVDQAQNVIQRNISSFIRRRQINA